MSTITDEDLSALLEGLASSYDVPAHGPAEVLSTLAAQPTPIPVVRRRGLQLSAAAAVALAGLVTALALGAGGGGGGFSTASKDSAGSVGVVKSDRGDEAASTPARQLTGLDQVKSGEQRAPAAGPAAAPLPLTPGASGASTGNVGAPAPDGVESRVVKTGTISLVVHDGDVSSTVAGVIRAAKAQGGYVASSQSNEYGETPSGEVTVRVPVDHFEELIAAVRGLDAEVRNATTSGKDVTAQYADIEAQLVSLKAARDRFLVILSQTKTISEILTVQQRVDTVQGQIDRLEGSRKLLASQSELSTLTVSVSEKDDPVVRVTAHRGGLSQAIHDAKDGFVTGVESIVRHSGRALLWIICLVGLALLVRGGWKVARRSMV
jgi:hypothetical protein